METKYNIMDIAGILKYQDIPLLDFEIVGTSLVKVIDLSDNGKYLPPWMVFQGLNYGSFNQFFNNRVVRNNTQDLRMYLDCLGLKHYDFNAIIKKMNGWNALDNWWVQFEGVGAKCWNDILNQKYPIM